MAAFSAGTVETETIKLRLRIAGPATDHDGSLCLVLNKTCPVGPALTESLQPWIVGFPCSVSFFEKGTGRMNGMVTGVPLAGCKLYRPRMLPRVLRQHGVYRCGIAK